VKHCNFCNDAIIFGGVRDADGQYCNSRCQDQAAARRRSEQAMRANKVQAIYTVQGVAEEMEVFDDKLTITPKGALGFMVKGLKGTKTILFFSINGMQYRKPGRLSGYLQFTIPGGNESKGGLFAAASDENTFMFDAKVDDVVIKVKDFIEKRIKEGRQPAPAQTASAADEIRKLAELREQGLLSEEEFSNGKKKLLGL